MSTYVCVSVFSDKCVYACTRMFVHGDQKENLGVSALFPHGDSDN